MLFPQEAFGFLGDLVSWWWKRSSLKDKAESFQVDADERRDYPARPPEAFLGVAVGHREGREPRPGGGGDPGRGVLDGEAVSGDDPVIRERGLKPRHRQEVTGGIGFARLHVR